MGRKNHPNGDGTHEKMTVTGQIAEIEPNGFTVFVPFVDVGYLVKKQVSSVGVSIDDGRTINREQQKKIYATLGDMKLFTGHEVEELKDILKCEYVAATGEPWFSLSSCTVTTASAFLQFIIERCIELDIPTSDNPIERAPDISRYLYCCLVYKVCAICGKKSGLHHYDRIGMGRNRKEVLHLGMKAQSLCWGHHKECHNIGQTEFDKLYHIYGIRLDEHLCGIWKLKGRATHGTVQAKEMP